MRPDQERIAEWLSERAPQLADVYRGAIHMLENPSIPGRQHFICHAARDIGNRTPELVAETAKIKRVEMTDELVRLEELWTTNRLDQLEFSSASAAARNEGIAQPRAELPVPYLVFRQIQSVIILQRQVSENRRAKVIKMLEAFAPENKNRSEILFPLSDQWMELTGWFVANTHAGNKPGMVDERELQSRFRALEDFLHTIIRGALFFGPVDTLDEILEHTNS